MSKKRIFRLGQGLLGMIGVASLLFACNGGIFKPADGGGAYTLAGIVSVDPNVTKTIAAADLQKDTLPAVGATVKFDGNNLTFDRAAFAVDSVFSIEWPSIIQLSSGNHTFLASDSTDLSAQAAIAVLPGAVAINNVTPANRISNGNELVKLEWSGGVGATGYVVAAVRKTQTYAGYGFSQYATSATATTFPREAFYQTNPNTPDTGWYYLYVYAFGGSPDSALSRVMLPVRMPSQLANNITSQAINGHVGGVMVSLHDSVHITLEP
jgi:hypothetical protein